MLYKISLITYHMHKNYFESFFEGVSDTISSFEEDETTDIDPKDQDKWIVEAYFEEKPPENLLSILEAYRANMDLFAENIKISIVENEDFATKVMMDCAPITVGRFYIHNSFYMNDTPPSLISLHIDSGMAFGTGDHETTSGCLEFLDEMELKGKNILDMGTGSGILSIAAAKMKAEKIISVDIDGAAVETADRNISLNGVEGKIATSVADGYSDFVKNNGPYDVILSNILAKPLIDMSYDLAASLKPGGICILSGFLEHSSQGVIAAHELAGLKLLKTKVENNWVTAKMQK